MTLVWSRRAVADLASLRQYIEQRSPNAASEVAARIVKRDVVTDVRPKQDGQAPRPQTRVGSASFDGITLYGK